MSKSNPQMEFPPSSWSIRDQGLFETAVVRTTNGLSMEVLAKVSNPKPYLAQYTQYLSTKICSNPD
jgi:hypothetical protein